MIGSTPLPLGSRSGRKSSLTALVCVLAVGLLAACTSSKTSAGTGGTRPAGAATSVGAAADASALTQLLEKGYRGVFDPPPSSGPKAVAGKRVWNISCGQAFATCAYMSQQFAAAGHVLGWDVVTQDSKGDPTTAANLINQAIAAKVDGITITSTECPTIKSALLAARAAHVPVVNLAGADCNDEIYGGTGAALFTATLNIMGSTNDSDYYQAWNVARADYLAARMGGSGKVLDVRETSNPGEKLQDQAFRDELAKQCPSCKVVTVDYTFAQIPNPATQIWKSALLANPDAKALEMSIDSLMGLGLQSAVQQSGSRRLLVVGGEGGLLNYDLIRQGVQTAAVPIPWDWFAWGLADTLNRVLAGADPKSLPSEGAGWAYVDKEHNLPPQGEHFKVPVDFRSAYTKIWSGR